MKALYAVVLSVVLGAPVMASAAGGVFPVDATSQTTITNVASDLVAWGVALLAVILTVYAFRKIRSIVR